MSCTTNCQRRRRRGGGHGHFYTTGYVTVSDGVSIFFRQWLDPKRTRRSAILIHGDGASSAIWECLANALANEGIAVLATDLRGMGYSGKPIPGDYSYARLLQDVQQVAVIRGFTDLPRTTLAGWSLGGFLSISWAVTGVPFQRLILVDTSPALSSPTIGRTEAYSKAIQLLLDGHTDAYLITFGILTLNDLCPPARVLDRLIGPLSTIARQASPDSLRELFQQNTPAPDLQSQLVNVVPPTLIFFGSRDAILHAAESSCTMRNDIPKAHIVELIGKGHASLLTASRRFVRDVVAFIRHPESVETCHACIITP